MMVSVAMITYGHEHYIEEAINGVLMQECNFEVELIIADDCSPDHTQQIVNRIISTHPNGSWIKYTRHKENLGIARNFAWSMLEGEGKYIAICEGDDYWTDPLKLQKQVDFLNANPNYMMACHSSNEVDANGNVFKIATRKDEVIDLSIVLKQGWFIRTASMLFRKETLENGFPSFFFDAYSTDYILQVMILKKGICNYFPEVMSAYRRHDGGISRATPNIQFNRWSDKLKLLDKIDQFCDFKYAKEIDIQKADVKMSMVLYLLKYPNLVKVVGFDGYLGRIFSKHFFKLISLKLKKKLKF